MNIRTSIRRRTHMVTILLFEEYLYKKREEFYGLYRLCGGIFGVLKLFVETSAGLVITKNTKYGPGATDICQYYYHHFLFYPKIKQNSVLVGRLHLLVLDYHFICLCCLMLLVSNQIFQIPYVCKWLLLIIIIALHD